MSRPASRPAARRVSLALAVALPAAAVAVGLPVVTPPAARPHPVPPTVHTLPLSPAPIPPAPGGNLRTTAAAGRPLVLTAPRATARYDLVGVTWAYDAHVGDLAVAVRTRTSGTWTPWHRLDAERDEAPDVTSRDMRGVPTRAGTAPYVVGGSDGLQVRVDLLRGRPPRDLRVDLVDPGRSAADADLGDRAAGSVAAASTSTPGMVRRRQWGADESLRRGGPGYSGTVKIGFVHHTDTGNAYPPGQAAAMVRSIYAYHTRSRGWSDIGYNFLVDRYGRIFEGRHGGIDQPVIGAHTGGFNANSVGVALLGTYIAAAPAPAQLRAVERLLAWKLGLHYRDPKGTDTLVSAGGGTSRYPSGAAVRFNVVSGHRDAGHTSCPGAATYTRMVAIRAAVHSHSGAGLVGPSVTPVGAGVRVTAGVLRAQRWVAELLATDGSTVLAEARGSTSGRIDTTLVPRRAAPADTYSVRVRSWSGGSGGNRGNMARPYDARVSLSGADQVDADAERDGSVVLATRADAAAATVRSWRPDGSLGGVNVLGGALVGGPDVLARGDGGIEVHVRGTDDAIYRKVRGQGWSGWQRLGGRVLAAPRAVELSSGGVALVVVGADRALWFRPSERSGWRRVGGAVLPGSAPAVAALPGGEVAVAVVGTDRRAWRTSLSSDARSRGWTPLGGLFTGDLTAVAPGAGDLLIAGGGGNGGIYALRITGGTAHGWTRVGGLTVAGSPALALAPQDGSAARSPRLVVAGADDRIYVADPAAGSGARWAEVR